MKAASKRPEAPAASSTRVRAVRSPTAERKALARMAELVTRELGIRMPHSKLAMLESRVLRRVRALQFDSIQDYETHLNEDSSRHTELQHFYDAVTTNKTDFFREPKHFKYLYKEALPTLGAKHAAASSWTCRVWCAGCSSGQEVYTLAMVLAEYQRTHQGFGYAILATDISSRVLDEAKRATYPAALAEPIPLVLRKRYLLRGMKRGQELIRIAPELRHHIEFARLNFMDERYTIEGRFDVIFFRNVMIYFDKPTQQAVILRQCKLLQNDGYFFISHTESLAGLDVPLRSVANAVFRKVR